MTFAHILCWSSRLNEAFKALPPQQLTLPAAGVVTLPVLTLPWNSRTPRFPDISIVTYTDGSLSTQNVAGGGVYAFSYTTRGERKEERKVAFTYDGDQSSLNAELRALLHAVKIAHPGEDCVIATDCENGMRLVEQIIFTPWQVSGHDNLPTLRVISKLIAARTAPTSILKVKAHSILSPYGNHRADELAKSATKAPAQAAPATLHLEPDNDGLATTLVRPRLNLVDGAGERAKAKAASAFALAHVLSIIRSTHGNGAPIRREATIKSSAQIIPQISNAILSTKGISQSHKNAVLRCRALIPPP